jgi:hypothetical protein
LISRNWCKGIAQTSPSRRSISPKLNFVHTYPDELQVACLLANASRTA